MNKDQFLLLVKAWADTRNDSLIALIEDVLEDIFEKKNTETIEIRQPTKRGDRMPVIATNIKTGERLEFSSQKEASGYLKVDDRCISNCVNGLQYKTKGWTFQRKNKED